MRIKTLTLTLSLVAVTLLFASCNTQKKVVYFQEEQSLSPILPAPQLLQLKPQDKLSIYIASGDPQLSSVFNLSSSTNGSDYSNNRRVYTVASDGTINFPIVGHIKVEGMTREEVVSMIEEQLKEKNLLNDPVAIVEFTNMEISVLGEVNRPGQQQLSKDYVTILEAISKAGDLTIQGRRDRVLVVRTYEGKTENHYIDLRSEQSIYSSPVYYLKQNDLVYVEPNNLRVRQTTVNGNNMLSTSFWMSAASFLMSIVNFLK